MAGGQRRALGTLFMLLGVLFAGIAYAAIVAGVWVVGVAAIVLALWIVSFGLRALLARRAR